MGWGRGKVGGRRGEGASTGDAVKRRGEGGRKKVQVGVGARAAGRGEEWKRGTRGVGEKRRRGE